jgi:sigma-B regulation protein RsbU (phosphoserine phosphatase)
MAGAFEHAVFETGRAMLNRGDCVFLFTDGVTEATDPNEEFFSEHRLRGILEKSGRSSVEEIVGNVLSEVRSFVAGSLPSDDVTVLALKYVGL